MNVFYAIRCKCVCVNVMCVLIIAYFKLCDDGCPAVTKEERYEKHKKNYLNLKQVVLLELKLHLYQIFISSFLFDGAGVIGTGVF